MYVFVRQDLPPPQQAIQAAHACIDVARTLLPPTAAHPHLVLIGISSEQALHCVAARLHALAIVCRAFHEPDLGNQLTAIATEPITGDRRRIFRRYQCLRSPGEFIDPETTKAT